MTDSQQLAPKQPATIQQKTIDALRADLWPPSCRFKHGDQVRVFNTSDVGTVTDFRAASEDSHRYLVNLESGDERWFPDGDLKRADETSSEELDLARDISDAKAIARARAKDGSKFDALWEGDVKKAGYASARIAEITLCMMLARQVGPSFERVDGLFRQSKLFDADRWDELEDDRAGDLQRDTLGTVKIWQAFTILGGTFGEVARAFQSKSVLKSYTNFNLLGELQHIYKIICGNLPTPHFLAKNASFHENSLIEQDESIKAARERVMTLFLAEPDSREGQVKANDEIFALLGGEKTSLPCSVSVAVSRKIGGPVACIGTICHKFTCGYCGSRWQAVHEEHLASVMAQESEMYVHFCSEAVWKRFQKRMSHRTARKGLKQKWFKVLPKGRMAIMANQRLDFLVEGADAECVKIPPEWLRPTIRACLACVRPSEKRVHDQTRCWTLPKKREPPEEYHGITSLFPKKVGEIAERQGCDVQYQYDPIDLSTKRVVFDGAAEQKDKTIFLSGFKKNGGSTV